MALDARKQVSTVCGASANGMRCWLRLSSWPAFSNVPTVVA